MTMWSKAIHVQQCILKGTHIYNVLKPFVYHYSTCGVDSCTWRCEAIPNCQMTTLPHTTTGMTPAQLILNTFTEKLFTFAFVIAEHCAGNNMMMCSYPPGRCGNKCDGVQDCLVPNDEEDCQSEF